MKCILDGIILSDSPFIHPTAGPHPYEQPIVVNKGTTAPQKTWGSATTVQRVHPTVYQYSHISQHPSPSSRASRRALKNEKKSTIMTRHVSSTQQGCLWVSLTLPVVNNVYNCWIAECPTYCMNYYIYELLPYESVMLPNLHT